MAKTADAPPLLYDGHLNASTTGIGAGLISAGTPQEDEEKKKENEAIVLDTKSGEISVNIEDGEDQALLGTDDPFVSSFLVSPHLLFTASDDLYFL